MTSLPSQAKAGPPDEYERTMFSQFDATIHALALDNRLVATDREALLWGLSRLDKFYREPASSLAPAALSVEEYAELSGKNWLELNFEYDKHGRGYIDNDKGKLHTVQGVLDVYRDYLFRKYFAGTVGQPPQDAEALAAKCADLASCCIEANARETYIRVWTPKFAELLRSSLPSESPAAPHAHEGFAAHITRFGEGVWDKNCPDCLKALNRTELAVPAAPEVPFSLPLRPSRGIDPTIIFDAKDEISIYINCPSNKPRTIKIRDYIISAVNSHEELKRQIAHIAEVCSRAEKNFASEVAVRLDWQCKAESAEKSASDKEQELAMLTKDFGELARKAESSERLNAELREALKDIERIAGKTSVPKRSIAKRARAAISLAEKAVRP